MFSFRPLFFEKGLEFNRSTDFSYIHYIKLSLNRIFEINAVMVFWHTKFAPIKLGKGLLYSDFTRIIIGLWRQFEKVLQNPLANDEKALEVIQKCFVSAWFCFIKIVMASKCSLLSHKSFSNCKLRVHSRLFGPKSGTPNNVLKYHSYNIFEMSI